ncbi:MAG: AraC family transcriptional regulator [Bacteroidetes bacterium]|nr:MAG: AraC family transcriptional regulator [Bacteroidota bacterium]
MDNLTLKTDELSKVLLQISHIRLPYFNEEYHSHDYYELALILKGYGKRKVCEKIDNFNPYDLVLIKKNILHSWKCDDIFYQGHQKLNTEAILLKFNDILLENLSFVPQSNHFIKFINNIEDVMAFNLNIAKKIKPLLLGAICKDGLEQISIILQIFHIISTENSKEFFSEPIEIRENNTARMTKIANFTLKNFRKKISLDEVADVANLTKSAFCRYFKKEKGKNYIDYVNELRIMYASDLLKNTEMSIIQIGLEAGFENNSHFFGVFKKVVKKTPLQYRKMQLSNV